MKSFNKENWLIAILTAFITSALSFYVGRYLLNKEISYDIRKTRIEIFKDASTLFSQSPYIRVITNSSAHTIVVLNSVSKVCTDQHNDIKRPETCNLNQEYDSLHHMGKEIFSFNAKYQSLRKMAEIYFCDDTNESFTKLGKRDWWIQEKTEMRELVLDSMYKELECKR